MLLPPRHSHSDSHPPVLYPVRGPQAGSLPYMYISIPLLNESHRAHHTTPDARRPGRRHCGPLPTDDMGAPAGEVTSISLTADRFIGARWMVSVNWPVASQSPHCRSCSGMRLLPAVSLVLVDLGSYLKTLAPSELAARPYAGLSERLLSTMSPDLRACAHARKGSAYKVRVATSRPSDGPERTTLFR